jgi:glycosyltransferase involved in cell wall biosynthesis
MPLSHLLILTPGFPSSEADTTCLPTVQQIVLSFQKQYPSLKISVISLHYPFTSTIYNWHNISVYPVDGRNKTGFRRGFTILKAVIKAKLLHKKHPVDAVMSLWLTDAALAGKYFSKLAKAPHFIWMHGQDARPGNKYVKWVNPPLSQLATMSGFQKNVFKNSYQKEVGHIIYNGINTDIFPAFNKGKRTIDLLAVGSLIPLKQYHFFIDVVNYLKNEGFTHIKSVLAGEGILLNELRALVEKYGLDQQVEILENVPHPNVLQLMKNARVFVHPSSYEGHSTVMVEALYSGCKVVSFIPAADTTIHNAILCNDIEEMKKECTRLLKEDWEPQQVLINHIDTSTEKIMNILLSQLKS